MSSQTDSLLFSDFVFCVCELGLLVILSNLIGRRHIRPYGVWQFVNPFAYFCISTAKNIFRFSHSYEEKKKKKERSQLNKWDRHYTTILCHSVYRHGSHPRGHQHTFCRLEILKKLLYRSWKEKNILPFAAFTLSVWVPEGGWGGGGLIFLKLCFSRFLSPNEQQHVSLYSITNVWCRSRSD